MKQIWHIAFIDIKRMVRDKTYFFWTLLFPLVFIFIFGNLFKGDTQPTVAALVVVNRDTGPWGAYFIEKIKAPGIDVQVKDKEPAEYSRILVIPEDFSKKITDKKVQQLVFKKNADANVQAAAQVETKIIQAIARTIAELILHPDTATFFTQPQPFKDFIEIKAGFPENTLKKTPSGFDHVIPGTIVQFIMMMVMIYGGIVVMVDRQQGILSRVLFSSTSIGQLWGGKFLGRLVMGIIQAFILVIAGKLFFNLNLGNNFLSLLNVAVFSITIASLSIFIGSVLNKEDLIVGVSILLANTFAALGGCWWPIEIVPQTFRTLGMISPAYWAMDSFHKIIFFNGGFGDIGLNLIVLLGFALVFTFLAVRFFRIRD
ncbi:MAG: transporter permease [Acidobacteriota bacterium]|nr:transporter permease [Acidobacteriota bacterium]